MDAVNVNQMTETQRRLYKKIQDRKKAEEAQKAKEDEAAATQQAKKKKRNRRKKKGTNTSPSENGEPTPPPSSAHEASTSSSAPADENTAPASQPALSTAAKKRRRKAAKKAAAAAAQAERSEPLVNGDHARSNGESSPSPTSPKTTASTDREEEKPAETEKASPKPAATSEEEKLDIDRSTFSDVQRRLKQLEDEALGRRPEVKGADKAPGWLGEKGKEKVMAGSTAGVKHHVVSGEEDLSDLDKAKMQALLGNAKAANTKSYVGLKNITKTLTSEDYDNKMTVVFQSCHGCHYTMDSMCTKVFVTACRDFTLTIDKKVVTQTLELYKCENATININVRIRTVQADMSNKVTLKFNTKENFDNVVWAGVEGLVTEFGDVPDRMATGWTEVQNEYANLNKERSQFKIHYVAGKLSLDKIIRMQDGFPTTKLEYDEHMRKQEAAIQAMAKNMGITIGKKVKPKEERAGRNDPCPCGNGKKYKKCCGK